MPREECKDDSKKNLELKAFINEDSIANLQFHLS